MELSTGTTCLLTILFIFLCAKDADAVNCYICSWTPQDKDVEADRCSTGNFDERRVRYINCPVGCEVVKILDSNGELLMFYRNCLMSSPNKFDYDRSNKKATVMTEEEMYACDSDLCNSSVFTRKISVSVIFASMVPLLSGPLAQFF